VYFVVSSSGEKTLADEPCRPMGHRSHSRVRNIADVARDA
jgi:hypothetical protein